LLQRREALALFAAWKEKRFVADAGKRARKRRALMPPHVLSADDEHLAGLGWNIFRRARDNPSFDNRRVAALRRLDAKFGHTPLLT